MNGQGTLFVCFSTSGGMLGAAPREESFVPRWQEVRFAGPRHHSCDERIREHATRFTVRRGDGHLDRIVDPVGAADVFDDTGGTGHGIEGKPLID